MLGLGSRSRLATYFLALARDRVNRPPALSTRTTIGRSVGILFLRFIPNRMFMEIMDE